MLTDLVLVDDELAFKAIDPELADGRPTSGSLQGSGCPSTSMQEVSLVSVSTGAGCAMRRRPEPGRSLAIGGAAIDVELSVRKRELRHGRQIGLVGFSDTPGALIRRSQRARTERSFRSPLSCRHRAIAAWLPIEVDW